MPRNRRWWPFLVGGVLTALLVLAVAASFNNISPQPFANVSTATCPVSLITPDRELAAGVSYSDTLKVTATGLGEPLWSMPLPDGIAPASLTTTPWKPYTYAASNTNGPEDSILVLPAANQTFLYGVSLQTGSVLWQQGFAGSLLDGNETWLWVAASEGKTTTVAAISTQDGSVAACFQATSPSELPPLQTLINDAPAFDGFATAAHSDTLYVSLDQSFKGEFQKLRADGQVQDIPAPQGSFRVVAANDTTLVLANRSSLWALDANNFSLQWQKPSPACESSSGTLREGILVLACPSRVTFVDASSGNVVDSRILVDLQTVFYTQGIALIQDGGAPPLTYWWKDGKLETLTSPGMPTAFTTSTIAYTSLDGKVTAGTLGSQLGVVSGSIGATAISASVVVVAVENNTGSWLVGVSLTPPPDQSPPDQSPPDQTPPDQTPPDQPPPDQTPPDQPIPPTESPSL